MDELLKNSSAESVNKSVADINEEAVIKKEATTKAIPVQPVKVKVKGRKKNKILRQVSSGQVYIQATYNNTMVTLTDQTGNVLATSSAGRVGFKGPKKSTPYAAGIIVKDAVNKAAPYGLREVNVFVKGVGSGREAAIRALNTNGLNVLSIKDVTPIPHNGCRPRKVRRV